ncbi:MAG TPA: AMP-binding protein [Mycobacteriales bacterium]|jgi:long-chain acyl-CoA synthetase|nr:AMP-binding protein [Mycobacteriales bacterium]
MAATNLAGLVRESATTAPDKIALVTRDSSVTWAELDRDVDRCAVGLLAAGHDPGSRIGILLPNSVAFAVAYFGILRAGLVAVPLNTGYTANELGYQLSDADVPIVITDQERAAVLRDAGDVTALVVDRPDGGWEQLLAAADGQAAVDSTAGGEDLAVLLYTSGTSGRPRGAMLTHRALLANLDQLTRIDPPVVAADDRVLLVLPLFHVYGLNAGLGMVAKAGATGVLAERFDPVETLALVREEQISGIIGAPPMYVAWSMLPDLGDSLSTVRVALSGAAPLPAAVLSAVLEASGHHIFEGYGLTETAPVLTTTLCSQVAKPGSVGRPVPGVELRVDVDVDIDDDESGDDPGEVVVRGPNLFSGYWPDGAGGPDEEGWFRTGDIGYLDEDGDLFLVDRTRDLIIVSGFNVYPREVEEALLAHPDVAEVAAIGVAHPYTGETVKALVVRRAGSAPSAEQLIDYAASRIARFKCPTAVEFVDELPHSLAGKVARGRLRDSSPSLG